MARRSDNEIIRAKLKKKTKYFFVDYSWISRSRAASLRLANSFVAVTSFVDNELMWPIIIDGEII